MCSVTKKMHIVLLRYFSSLMMTPTMKNNIRFLLCVLTGCLLPSLAQAQQVSPFQGGHNTVGFMNIRDLARPDPGNYALAYTFLGVSDRYYNAQGDLVEQLPIGDQDVDVNLSAQSLALALSFAWVKKISGELNYMGFLVPTWVGGNASSTFSLVGDGTTESTSLSGLGDIMLAPAYLSWGNQWFDVTGGYALYAPLGEFAAGGDENLSLGHFTNQFQLAGYFYLLDKAFALTGNLTYELPSRILGSEVTPGQRLSIEYGVSQYFTEWLEFGVYGGHNFQVTQDVGEGVVWDASVKDRKSIVGGQLGIWPSSWAEIVMRLGAEYGARQQFAGTTSQLNVVFVLDPEKPSAAPAN